MDKQLRNVIAATAQRLRTTLEREFSEQLEGVFDVHASGEMAAEAGRHLEAHGRLVRSKVVGSIEYHRAAGLSAAEAVARFIRDAAFTTLNRFVALKMLEARELVQQCVSRGDESSGYREFVGLAPGVAALDNDAGYRLYLEALFDELGTEIKVLFDRRDSASLLWPRYNAFEQFLDDLNRDELDSVWNDDETIGWFYQFFNSKEERQQMRDESQSPRNGRELAVRNQFFTPRYVVQFLVENTLGRMWTEMVPTSSLGERCEYLVELEDARPARSPKDPRDFRILDPACGSGHFLLYSFDLVEQMYRDAWEAGLATDTRPSLRECFATSDELTRAIPVLILEHNLHGVDIDPRATQIAALALWLRAQRSWREAGVAATDRPAIRRTGVVVAEPMPGDGAMIDEFAGALDPPLLGLLFRQIASTMRLAGEMGTLLRPEAELAEEIARARLEFVVSRVRPKALPGFEADTEQSELDLSGIDDDDFFTEAEQRLLSALHAFALGGEGDQAPRRRLFADDAGQGVALLELLRQRYDVVLMNPPFGEPIDGTFEWLRSSYLGAHNDLYASFVARGVELASEGFVGAVTSRSFLVAPRLEAFRRDVVAPRGELLLDLRQGVMDEAAVEASALVLSDGASRSMVFIDASDGRRVLPDLSAAILQAAPRFDVPRPVLTLLHQARILYRLPQSLYELLDRASPFEPDFGTAREGPKTFDNARFLRLRWEIPRDGRDVTGWRPFAKGGDYFFGVSPPHLYLNWSNGGAELRALNFAMNGSTSQVRQASRYWFRAGVTYSKRSQRGFSSRALPAGSIFSSNGPALLSQSVDVTPHRILAWINSRPLRALLNLQSNFADYSTGVIKTLPWPEAMTSESWTHMEGLVTRALSQLVRASAGRETSPYFALPFSTVDLDSLNSELAALDDVTSRAFADGLQLGDLAWADDVLAPESGWRECIPAIRPDVELSVDRVRSWAAGVALGRFALVPSSATADPFAEIFLLAPAESGGEGVTRLPTGDGIAVEDREDERDLAAAIVSVVEGVEPNLLGGLKREELLDVEETRKWITSRLFSIHLERYSESARQAPLYWPLGTRSGSFLVWLYAHRVTADSLYGVVQDVVLPKLAVEERALTDLRQDAGPNPSASQRKTIDAQDRLVGELRELREELEAVAPLWAPDLNDGIVIVLAPLWRLFVHHRAWSAELKKHWVKLAKGDYDWAQLAIHLWPERVIPKCAEDRSLAIAHSLEDVFWIQDSANADKWHARTEPTTPIDQLIADRHNPATHHARQRATT